MPRKATIVPFRCAQCGETQMLPKSSVYKSRKFCSTECRDAAKLRREKRTCPVCSVQFTVVRCAPNIYCSQRCWKKVAPQQQKRVIYRTAECRVCGKTFEVRRRDASGRYCSRGCSDRAQKVAPALPDEVLICPTCGNEFRRRPGVKTLHCCWKCAKNDPAVKRTGRDHWLWKPKIPMKCVHCGKVCLVKPSLVSRFRFCSRRCNGSYQASRQPTISSIERAIAEQFTRVGLTPVAQYVIGHWTLDFAFPEAKVAVECDGDYWHALPATVRRDKIKDAQLRRKGWTVVRLKESDIKSDPAACVSTVAAKLHGPSVQLRLV